MNQKTTLIADNSALLPSNELVFELGQSVKSTFEIPMTQELSDLITPYYVDGQTYAIFYIPGSSKQIQLKSKLYSNALVIKGSIEINQVGDLDVILYLRHPNKKLSKLGTLKVSVFEKKALETYDFDEELATDEPISYAASKTSIQDEPIDQPIAAANNTCNVKQSAPSEQVDQRTLIDAILNIRPEVQRITQAYFEDEISDRIGSK